MPAELLCLRIIWDRQVIPLPHNELGFHQLHVSPEPAYPFGRKGLALASAWQQIGTATTAGMLLLDGDVVIDPHDLAAMHAAINKDPEGVWTAPVRLWRSAMREAGGGWIWSHLTGFPRDQAHLDEWDEHKDFRFSFCFTYLPRHLIVAAIKASPGLKTWAYPHCDMRMHQLAARRRVPVRIVRDGCTPKHLNY